MNTSERMRQVMNASRGVMHVQPVERRARERNDVNPMAVQMRDDHITRIENGREP